MLRTAAWSVPAVTLVTAAPAFADSKVDDIALSPPTFAVNRNGVTATVTGVTLINDGPNDLTVTVVLTLTAGGNNYFSAVPTDTDWTFSDTGTQATTLTATRVVTVTDKGSVPTGGFSVTLGGRANVTPTLASNVTFRVA